MPEAATRRNKKSFDSATEEANTQRSVRKVGERGKKRQKKKKAQKRLARLKRQRDWVQSRKLNRESGKG